MGWFDSVSAGFSDFVGSVSSSFSSPAPKPAVVVTGRPGSGGNPHIDAPTPVKPPPVKHIEPIGRPGSGGAPDPVVDPPTAPPVTPDPVPEVEEETGLFDYLFDTPLDEVFGDIGEGITSGVDYLTDTSAEDIYADIGSGVDYILNTPADEVFPDIVGGIEDFVGGVEDAITGVQEGISEFVGTDLVFESPSEIGTTIPSDPTPSDPTPPPSTGGATLIAKEVALIQERTQGSAGGGGRKNRRSLLELGEVPVGDTGLEITLG